MTRNEIENKLISELDDLGTLIDTNDFNKDVSLEEAGMDSLDIVNFLLSIEENYGVKISDDEMATIQSFNQIVDHVQKMSV